MRRTRLVLTFATALVSSMALSLIGCGESNNSIGDISKPQAEVKNAVKDSMKAYLENRKSAPKRKH